MANKTMAQLEALAAFKVGARVETKKDIIASASVKGKKIMNMMIQKGVSVKKRKPKERPAK